MHLGKKINIILLQNSAVITLVYDMKEEVMKWILDIQLGRRNLPPVQRLAVMDKFKKKIQEQAKENMSIGGSSDKKGSPNGETLIKKQTHTDKELAKMAGVGTGTVARFNKVMNSDDEELKKKVLANEVSINAGYEKVKRKKRRTSKITVRYLYKFNFFSKWRKS